jgi:DUF1009 family protein
VTGARAAGLAGIAVGAGRSITLERAALVAAADAAGLFVVGIHPPAPLSQAPLADMQPFTVHSRRAPTPNERGDIGIGRRLLPVLIEEGLGRAAIVSRHHVLSVAGGHSVSAMIAALGRDGQWGRRRFRKQLGVLVMHIAAPSAVLGRDVFQAAAEAKLAGIVCFGGPLPEDRFAEIVGWANDGRMFLLAEAPPKPDEPDHD